MRRRAARVKLSTTTSYKVRNLGDIGDVLHLTAGLLSLKRAVRFTLDFVFASTNLRVPHAQRQDKLRRDRRRQAIAKCLWQRVATR